MALFFNSVVAGLDEPETKDRCSEMQDVSGGCDSSFFCSETNGVFSSEIALFRSLQRSRLSHVASRCKERLHELVQEEALSDKNEEWKKMMERIFTRMNMEAVRWEETVMNANCKCELQTPNCDAVGSTAVVSVITPEKIIVANCGDSRAVLCRNGKPVPLSTDHKPDRPDELDRIQEAGGRVKYWDGPRVLGVLATSRAIGDNYLKPYVSSEPEITVTERSKEYRPVRFINAGRSVSVR